MNDRLKTIVDLKKYPIYDLNSPIIKNLIKKCKEELDQYSCSTIPNFILPKSLKVMNSELEKQLDEVYQLMIDQQEKRLNLSGHACILGPDAFNKYLSKKIAKEVMNYLVNKGVPRERILVRGYGSSQPIGDNNTYEGRAMNRRVEMQLID